MSKRRELLFAAVLLLLMAAAVGLWKYHEQPQSCATCHIMKPYLESWRGSSSFAKAHREAGDKCLDCHQPLIQQQLDEALKFVTGRYQNPLEMRTFGDEFCLRCHGSLQEVAKRTEGYRIELSVFAGHDVQIDQLTEEDLAINPHTTHVSQEGCYNCHKMHRDSPQLQYCFNCHHRGGLVNCSECHAE